MRKNQIKDSPPDKRLIITNTSKRKAMQDYDHESALEEQVAENISNLIELKELRHKSNSEEYEKTRTRREMICRRTLKNLKESCEAEKFTELAKKCTAAVDNLKERTNPDTMGSGMSRSLRTGTMDTSFKIPKLVSSDKHQVTVTVLGTHSKNYKVYHFQGARGANKSPVTLGYQAEPNTSNDSVFQMNTPGSMDVDDQTTDSPPREQGAGHEAGGQDNPHDRPDPQQSPGGSNSVPN